MDWGRRICLLSSGLDHPVTAVLRLMRVEREVRLLRVVAVMMVEMRVVLDGWEISSTVAVIVRVWCSPYLALWRSSRRPIILVGETMRLVAPLTRSLLLLVGQHPCTLVREVAVVAPPTHVVMRVVAASLCPHWRWSLIGCPRVGTGLLDGSQSAFSHAVWRSVTPGPFGPIIFLHCLLLPERGRQPTALSSNRKHLRPPGQLRIHRGRTTMRVPWMLLLPVKWV